MRYAILAAALFVSGCAGVSNEISNWNGTLSYNPATGKWEVSFSRPGNLTAGDGKAVIK